MTSLGDQEVDGRITFVWSSGSICREDGTRMGLTQNLWNGRNELEVFATTYVSQLHVYCFTCRKRNVLVTAHTVARYTC
jgi:hypothetical protein